MYLNGVASPPFLAGAGVSAFGALVFSSWLIRAHLRNYTEPVLQVRRPATTRASNQEAHVQRHKKRAMRTCIRQRTPPARALMNASSSPGTHLIRR